VRSTENESQCCHFSTADAAVFGEDANGHADDDDVCDDDGDDKGKT